MKAQLEGLWAPLIGIFAVLGGLLFTLYLASCARLAQFDVEQAGLCLEPPEEHLFAFNGEQPQLIYRFACLYENTGEPNACCDYVQADARTGVYCMHRFCTGDCRSWEYAGYDCPEPLQGLIQ